MIKTLHHTARMVNSNTLCTVGVELRSPKFALSDASNWKTSVMETWKSLVSTVKPTKNYKCRTHVHISMTQGAPNKASGGLGMGLQNMKKIAQCAIHFEPALEALGCEYPLPCSPVASNWIDNKNFAYPDVTRQVAMQMIENCNTEDQLIDLMCPNTDGLFWAWNFRAMKTLGTIEFRNGDTPLNGYQAIAWAELVVLFVQAAIKTKPSSVSTIPANIRGLKEFLGLDKLHDLKPLLDGTNADDCFQPQVLLQRNQEEVEMLQEKLRADDERQRRVGR